MLSAKEKILQKAWNKLADLPDFAFIKKLKPAIPTAKIYLVGGAVRDMLLKNQEIVDFDFVIREAPVKKLAAFLKTNGTINLVGKKFGVYKLKPFASQLKEDIDIALPRTEITIGKNGAHKDFIITSDAHLHIEADLSRRDFTINALAWDIYNQRLIDPYNGIKDLNNKTLNTVGLPQRRFAEDLARILRAVRFACQLNFKITPRVWKNIKTLSPKINKQIKNEWVVPREVLAKEFIKAFTANPLMAFDLFYQAGLIKILVPELIKMQKCPQPKNYHTEGDVWTHTRLALAILTSPSFKKTFPRQPLTPLTVMAVLFHDVAKPLTIKTPEHDGTDRIRFNNHDQIGGEVAAAICRRLKLSSYGKGGVNSNALSWLIKKHLLLVHGNIEEIKNSTLEKYFFDPLLPGQDLLCLLYADGSATIPRNGKINLQSFKFLRTRLKKIEKVIAKQPTKKSIISGDDIINHYQIKAGPKIGELLNIIREAELAQKINNKKEALNLIKNYLK